MSGPYKQPDYTIKEGMSEDDILTKTYITFEINVVGIEILRCGLVLLNEHVFDQYLDTDDMVDHLKELFGKDFANDEEIRLTYSWIAERLETHRDELLDGRADRNLN